MTSVDDLEEGGSTRTSAAVGEESWTRRLGRVRWGELVIEGLIQMAGVSSVVIIALIFFFLLREGLPTFLDIPLRQLFGTRW